MVDRTARPDAEWQRVGADLITGRVGAEEEIQVVSAADGERGAVEFDAGFDVRSDAGLDGRGRGRDPDRYSATLRRAHRALWSKPLPGGQPFTLADSFPAGYLTASTALGELALASDSIVHTLTSFRSMQPVLAQLEEEEVDDFLRVACTVAGYVVFPADRVLGKQTINQARGLHPAIRDRFDLTMECIRRHYAGIESPLSSVLARFGGFFDLFSSFRGYTEFFLLQDLVHEGADRIRFWTESGEAPNAPLPDSVRSYRAFRDRSTAFVMARHARIEAAQLMR